MQMREQTIDIDAVKASFGAEVRGVDLTSPVSATVFGEIEAARLLTLRAAALKDAGKPAKTAASMAKVFASEVAMKAATKSLHEHRPVRLDEIPG